MGTNAKLKKEAVAAMEAGNVMAFGVSEKDHGSDLMANEFTVAESDTGDFIANGTKYYIGNTDAASMISILGRRISTGNPARKATSAARIERHSCSLLSGPDRLPHFAALGKSVRWEYGLRMWVRSK